MSADPPRPDPPARDEEPPFDPVRERERILSAVRGKTLDGHRAELVCAALAWLAELEAERPAG